MACFDTHGGRVLVRGSNHRVVDGQDDSRSYPEAGWRQVRLAPRPAHAAAAKAAAPESANAAMSAYMVPSKR